MAYATITKKGDDDDFVMHLHEAENDDSWEEPDAEENGGYHGPPPLPPLPLQQPLPPLPPPPPAPHPLQCCLKALCANKWKTGAVCLFLVVVGLLIHVGVSHSKGSAKPWEPGPPSLEAGCLWVGAQRVAAANTSVSPCDDFFQFACGGHRDSDPVLAVNSRRNLTSAKLDEMLLGQPLGQDKNSADAKLRALYRDCLAEGTRHRWAVATVQHHLQGLGGWWLLPPWKPGSFDLQDAMFYSSVSLHLDLFFTMRGRYLNEYASLFHLKPRFIRLPDSEQGLRLFEEYVAKITQLYLQEMKGIGLDNVGGDNATENIQLFVRDVLNMRRMLEEAGVPSSPSEERSVYLNHKTVLPRIGRDLNWTRVTYGKLGIRETRKDMYTMSDYLVGRAWVEVLNTLVSPEQKRMLNSYIVWQILEDFIIAMPLKYQRVKETFMRQVGWEPVEDRRESCQRVLTQYLSEPLGSLYARHYSETGSKEMITDIASQMRFKFLDDIKQFPWIDEESKETARDKVSQTEIEVEYPEALKKKTIIDRNYKELPISDGGLFIDNYLAVKAFQRNIKSRMIKENSSDTYAFDSDIQTVPQFNLIGIPALELPVFGTCLPMHHNMASLGPLLGRSFDRIIKQDEGHWLHYQGGRSKNALTFASLENWLRLLEQSPCQDNVTLPASPQPFLSLHSLSTKGKEDLITEITAVRQAYKAYQEWKEQNISAPEKSIPGIPMTPDQSFFMTYAQMKCPLKNETHGKEISTSDRVNFVLSQLPEFAEAFGCGGSPMNPEDKCVLNILQR